MKPTTSELEILQILWKKGLATVKDVNNILNEKRKVGYTTTLKMMQLMHEKKILDREENGRSHIYTPLLEEKKAKNPKRNNTPSTRDII